MSSTEYIVVGAGLFGSVLTDHLRRQGREVVQINQWREDAGSRPAACLMKPSWYSSVPRADDCLELLNSLYGVEQIGFQVGPVTTGVNWVRPAKILQRRDVREGWVLKAEPRRVLWREKRISHLGQSDPQELECSRAVIVAAGVWTRDLLLGVDVHPRTGQALLWPGETGSNFISPWAPYRQIVGFNRGDGYWCGDGSAISRWSGEHEANSYQRISGRVPFKSTPIQLIGHRPYCPGAKPALCEEIRPGLWVATGGAKNGTIAAAWCALKMGEYNV